MEDGLIERLERRQKGHRKCASSILSEKPREFKS